MKVYFLIFISTFVIADTCTEIADRLAQIEQSIDAVDKCADSDSDPRAFCRFDEAKIDYNKTLAKLVIARALKAVRDDVQISVEGLQELSLSQLNAAGEALEDFGSAIETGEAIEQALDENFLYNFNSEESSLEDYCQEQTQIRVCQGLKQARDKENFSAVVSGFSQSYRQLDSDYRHTKQNLETIKNNLQFELDGQTQDFSKLRDSELYTAVMQYKELLAAYRSTPSDQIAANLVAATTKLKELKFGFPNDTVLNAQFIDQTLRDDVQSVISHSANAYTVLKHENYLQKKLNNTLSVLEAQRDRLMAAGDGNNKQQAFELNEFASILRGTDQCLVKDLAAPEKEECINSLLKAKSFYFVSDVDHLEKDLEKKAATLKRYADLESIQNLEADKIQAMQELWDQGCFEKVDVQKNCNPEDVVNLGKEELFLTSSIGEILVSFHMDDIQQAHTNIPAPEIVEAKAVRRENTGRISELQSSTITRKERRKMRKKEREARWVANAGKRAKRNTAIAAGVPYAQHLIGQFGQMRQQRQYFDWNQTQNACMAYAMNLYMNYGAGCYNPWAASTFNSGNPYLYGGGYVDYTFGQDNLYRPNTGLINGVSI